MSTPFVPNTALEKLVHAADYAGLLNFLRPLSEAERRRFGAEAVRLNDLIFEFRWKDAKASGPRWDARPTKEQEHAAHAAVVLCSSPKAIAHSWVEAEHLVSLGREFGLSYMAEVANAFLARGAQTIRIVQLLVGERLIPRPDSDEYSLGLVCLRECLPRGKTLEQCFEDDPGLKRALLRMFDVEGNSQTSLASGEKYGAARHGWTETLLRLCDEGVFTREELIDRTLSALERDWPQYRSGWFSRFHEDLSPTMEEMASRRDRYLHLLNSRIPPTVGLALSAVSAMLVAGVLEGEATVGSLRPVLERGNKQQVESGLKLLQRCIAQDASLSEEAARIACAALVTEAPPLQKKLLQFIAPLTSPAVMELLQRYREGIAASNLALFQEIAASGAVAAPCVDSPELPGGAGPINPLGDDRRIQPVADLDELVESIAFAFENPSEFEAFERAATSLIARQPFTDTELARFAPLLKRAAKVKALLPSELARLLVFVCRGERLPPAPDPEHFNSPNQALLLVRARIDALIEAAKRGGGLAPLATPTHRRGFVHPVDLVARVREYERSGAVIPEFEQQLALLRLGPHDAEALERARELKDTALARALRYALGDDLRPGREKLLYCAASRIRHRRMDDDATLKQFGDVGPDGPSCARYSWDTEHSSGSGWSYRKLRVGVLSTSREWEDRLIAVSRHPDPQSGRPVYARRFLCGADAGVVGFFGSLLPNDPEALFAEGARQIGNNLYEWEAQWQDKAYLEPLLDPSVEMGEMATLVLVCGLLVKEPGQSALAVDCLVQAHRDGRLNASLLAEVHSRLCLIGLARIARLRKCLDAALRLESSIDSVVIVLVEHLIKAIDGEPPKDFAKLLEILNEICVALGRRPTPETLHALRGLKLGGAAVSLRKSLASRQ
jgi:hypothetical protein